MDWGFSKLPYWGTGRPSGSTSRVKSSKTPSPPPPPPPPGFIICEPHAYINPQHRQSVCRQHQAVCEDQLHRWQMILVSAMAPGLQWNQVRAQTQTDLEVLMSDSMQPANHIQEIAKKAYQRIGVIKSCFSGLTQTEITTLYQAILKPILAYASPAWNPNLVKYTKNTPNLPTKYRVDAQN